jgi:hypothetical protein
VNSTLQEKLQYLTTANIYAILNGLKRSKSSENLFEKLLTELGNRKIQEYDLVE